jgi:hypothetical protein
MQMQIKVADSQDGPNKHDADDNHQDVDVTWGGDEARQMMRRGGVKRFAQASLPLGNDRARTSERHWEATGSGCILA